MLVVAYHIKTNAYDSVSEKNIFEFLFTSGAFGVDLFFIISGFIIAFSTERRQDNNAINYIVKRFFRIYPLLFVTVLIYIIINPVYLKAEVIKSLFFINRDYGKPAPFFGYNVLFPAWSLSYEVYFYCIFGLAMFISHSKRIFICSLLLLIPSVFLQLIFNSSISLKGGMQLEGVIHNSLNFFASPMMYEFIVGMVMFRIMHFFSNLSHYKLISMSLFILFLLCYLTTYHYTVGLYGFGIWALLLISAALIWEKNNMLPTNQFLNFFGDISYSLYLSHAVIMQIMIRFHDYLPLYEKNSPLKFFELLILSIALAYFLHKLVERPMLKVGSLTAKFFNTK